MQRQTTWIEKGTDYFLVTEDGEVIGTIMSYNFPFKCFIGGAGAGEYTTLEIAKEKLLRKCKAYKLV